ncbi:MAG TPA: vanadium-dependent haloperoxidase, partial [Oligoflexus sp.]
PSGNIGTHDVDPLNPEQGFLDPAWGSVRPFAIPNTTRFTAPPPPSLRSREYAAAFDEVKKLGGDGVTTSTKRTDEQTIIGIFWGYDGAPGIGTPPRLYNQVARTIAVQKKNKVSENARLLALVNMAIADAAIQCWSDKYKYILWRPIRGIRMGDRDGNSQTNGNSDWSPLGAPTSNTRNRNFTPNFPAYTSGHAVLGAAGMGMIQQFYGTDNIAFIFVSDEFNGKTRGSDGNIRPFISRSYSSITQAIDENADSRIYLGVHWRFDLTEGVQSGLGIAEYIAEARLKPL